MFNWIICCFSKMSAEGRSCFRRRFFNIDKRNCAEIDAKVTARVRQVSWSYYMCMEPITRIIHHHIRFHSTVYPSTISSFPFSGIDTHALNPLYLPTSSDGLPQWISLRHNVPCPNVFYYSRLRHRSILIHI